MDPFNISDSPQSLAALAVQSDGKVIMGGVNFLARYHFDGTKETGFSPSVNNTVYSLSLQPDGKILVGGEFTSLAGFSRNYLGRLNTNGTLDTGFTASVNGRAQCLALQSDGKIIVAGRRTTGTGYVVRLGTTGATDATFSVPSGVSGPVTAMALQEEGKVLLGGLFLSAGGQSRLRLARLETNGLLDTTFNPGADGIVTSLAVQSDGLILVGGNFNTIAGQPRTNLARLNADGSLDNTFDSRVTGSSTPTVYSLAIQADGKITFSGLFNAVAGQTRLDLARVLSNGILDTFYTVGANNIVYGLGLWEDGRLQVAGDFNLVGGNPRFKTGRFLPAEPATESLAIGGSSVTWARGGSAPEVWRATFEVSTNLSQWTMLGDGSRIPGGWELTAVSLPPGGRVRARGYASGGGFNGSGWFVETVSGPCYFVTQPSNRTNNAGSTVLLSALAEGSPPLSYQWLKNGAPIQNGGSISGAQMAAMSLAPVFGADQGNYSLAVSNVSGSITSSVALLKVVDPLVTSVYLTNYANLGDNINISVNATGTPPLVFQWLKNGAELTGATTAAFGLTNVQAADAGTYAIRVTNAFGTMTSNRMTVEVNVATPDNFAPNVAGDVRGIAARTDGSVVFGGFFSSVNGEPRSSLARVDASGAVQGVYDFQSNPNDTVYTIGVQPDNSFLASGGFLFTNLTATNGNLARFTTAETLDPSFLGPTANSILTMARQTNGMMLVGGWGEVPFGLLARINANGNVDTNFDPNPDGVIRAIAVQPDGNIVVGGGINHIGGQSRGFIARLTPGGAVDPGFNPAANNYVNCIAVQPDGKILVGGEFTTLGGQPRTNLARLLLNGALDLTFNPGVGNYPGGVVHTIALQADGKILVGGEFSWLGGIARGNLGRLLPNGVTDPTFNPNASRSQFVTIVEALGVLADGKTLVAGAFDFLRGQPRANVGRLNATDPATQALVYDGSAVTWLRGGTSPEVWYTTFEYSTNSTDWETAGYGTRITGGWRLTNPILPERSTLRARGYVVGGYYNGSSWFVESQMTVVTPPLILVNDPRFGISSNQFRFPVRAVTGQNVVIERSTNLQNWVSIATNLVATPVFDFADSSSAPARFYRVRVLVP